MKNLLYCLLLASANEAANVLAMAVSGDIPTFVELMNQRAQELGMAGTHLSIPMACTTPTTTPQPGTSTACPSRP